MDREVEKKIFLGIILALIIGVTLALYTDNPREGTPNQDLNREECKSIGFYAPECPTTVNESNQTSTDNNQSSLQPDNHSET